MIDDGRQFFASHQDAEVRSRGLMLIEVIEKMRDAILARHFFLPMVKADPAPAPEPAFVILEGPPLRRLTPLRAFQKDQLIDALQVSAGSKKVATRMLGVARQTLYRRMHTLGLSIVKGNPPNSQRVKCKKRRDENEKSNDHMSHTSHRIQAPED